MNLSAYIMMIYLRKIISICFFIALAASVLSAGCTNPEKQIVKSLIPETDRLGSTGFLPVDSLPDSLALIPPPPAEDTIAYELDKEINRSSFSLRGSPRWDMAAKQFNDLIPDTINSFHCSLNAQITDGETPYLYALLYRVLDDIRFTGNEPAYKYNRPRPFFVNNEPKCFRQKRGNYASYPAGSAFWAMALILSEIADEKSDDILARGRALGQSYVICNFAWQSDVNEGRILASIVVARLHALPEFQAYVKEAKAELASVRAKDLPPIRDCDAENAVLFQNSLTRF